MNFLTKSVLSFVSMVSVFAMLQGCGGGSESGACCQENNETAVKADNVKADTTPPEVKGKIQETDKVVTVPEQQGERIVYVDRNVTVIQYVDRNITVIKYVDRNVTVEKVKVRPEAKIAGLNDGAVLTGNTLVIDGARSSDFDGNVTKYQWSLDDVNISTEVNPTIDLPTLPGDHKICLEVIDDDNLTSLMTCRSFVIPPQNQDPVASIDIPLLNDINGTGKIKTLCPFEVDAGNSVATNANIVSYVWTVDDNQTLNGKKQTLSFATLGNHEVCLEVTDSNGLKNKSCKIIDVKDHDAPTPKMTVTEPNGGVITKDSLLRRLGRYNLSCAGSKDDCGTDENLTCEWNAYSYKIGANGEEIPYVGDCFNSDVHDGHGPRVAKESWLILCSSGANLYTHIHVDLKVTDKFGKTATQKLFFEVGQ